jgi:hypothetical protein
MITALQNFISKKGRIVFILLLVVVIISFVLYLAQGTSIFDLFPDSNREKKEFYGHDLNDPEEMRFLSIENRVASDFGAIIPPLAESMGEADKRFMESLQAQLQAAFQANQQDVDRSALQRLFGFMQSWPNLPKNFKAREIARSGEYEPQFSQASLRAKIVMEAQAKSWSYLSEEESHIGINDGFNRYVRELYPNLTTDENRTQFFGYVGLRQGVKTSFVESTLFRHFRASQVDRIYSEGGFTLNKEGELDLFANQFAWDANLLLLNSDDLNTSAPSIFSISLDEKPLENDSLSVSYGKKVRKFIFVANVTDRNSSNLQVEIGTNVANSLVNLIEALELEDFDFTIQSGTRNSIRILPVADNLPPAFPTFTPEGSSIIVKDLLTEKLKQFHQDNNNEDIFMEPSRTFATMVTFATKDFISIPPEPEESRLRTYFDLNRDQFNPVPTPPEPELLLEGEKGPTGENESNKTGQPLNLVSSELTDANQTADQVVLFEDVREEIRLRIIEEDRLDAEREAKDLARESSLDFLSQLNELRDQVRSKYSTFSQKRNSDEMISLIKDSGATQRKISFAVKDMGVQAAILGMERRESERRNNREPLEEVSALNERLFFTRSTRTVRDGFSIFILDRKTSEIPGEFEKVSFADVYREFMKEIKSNAFSAWTEEAFSAIRENENNQTVLDLGDLISIEGKSLSSIQSSFDFKNQLLRSRLSKLEGERGEITQAERESNASAEQTSRKATLDKLIDDIRGEQDRHNQNRTLSIQLVEACPNLELGQGWTELERTEGSAVFVRLNEVYSLKAVETESEEAVTRVGEIELSRSESDRDLILRDLLQRELSKH